MNNLPDIEPNKINRKYYLFSMHEKKSNQNFPSGNYSEKHDVSTVEKKFITPEEISSLILKKLKEGVRDFGRNPKKACYNKVPTHFNNDKEYQQKFQL